MIFVMFYEGVSVFRASRDKIDFVFGLCDVDS